METPSGLTIQELETLSSKAIAAKANAYCMFHNKHHSSITWTGTLSLPPMYWDKFWDWAGPYSKFRVGACVLTKAGEYIAGANIENVAYPVGTCAERVAFGTAIVSTSYDVSLSTWLVRVNAYGWPETSWEEQSHTDRYYTGRRTPRLQSRCSRYWHHTWRIAMWDVQAIVSTTEPDLDLKLSNLRSPRSGSISGIDLNMYTFHIWLGFSRFSKATQ